MSTWCHSPTRQRYPSKPPRDRISAIEGQALAVTTFSFIRIQVATWQFFKDKATQLQTETEEVLPAEVCAIAITRSQICTLEEIVAILLNAATVG